MHVNFGEIHFFYQTYSSQARHKDKAFKGFIVNHEYVEGVVDVLSINPFKILTGMNFQNYYIKEIAFVKSNGIMSYARGNNNN